MREYSRKALKCITFLFLIALALAVRDPGQGAYASSAATTLSFEARFFERRLEIALNLPEAAPYRVFTLTEPLRLVVDVEDADAFDRLVQPDRLPRTIAEVRYGRMHGDWSRLVLTLSRPIELQAVELQAVELATGDGPARLDIQISRVSVDRMRERAGAPPGVWPPAGPVTATRRAGDGAITIVIDPGHGGLDPGAVAGDLYEKDIVLAFAETLRDRLLARGLYSIVMTREADLFVSLTDRLTIAREAQADLLISLHTNAVEGVDAAGAIAFTRSDRGSTAAAEARALLENAADEAAGIVASVDASVFTTLADMARRHTDRRSKSVAGALVSALEADGIAISRYPRQSANFVVLSAPEIPSVLLEIGFLSDPEDRDNMLRAPWRSQAAEAIVSGLDVWLKEIQGLSAGP